VETGPVFLGERDSYRVRRWVTPTSALCSERSTRRPETTSGHVLIRDQADRDAISSRLMRYRDQNGQGWTDGW
jgi:hypothetical protein